jgi:hypothetical protein
MYYTLEQLAKLLAYYKVNEQARVKSLVEFDKVLEDCAELVYRMQRLEK